MKGWKYICFPKESMVLIAPIITTLTKELITIKHNFADRDNG
jgi:hypothetical protein